MNLHVAVYIIIWRVQDIQYIHIYPGGVYRIKQPTLPLYTLYLSSTTCTNSRISPQNPPPKKKNPSFLWESTVFLPALISAVTSHPPSKLLACISTTADPINPRLNEMQSTLLSSFPRAGIRRPARPLLPVHHHHHHHHQFHPLPSPQQQQQSAPSAAGTGVPTSQTIFSGIQPTGIPHLGNYLGALRKWVSLQRDSPPDTSLIFCLVDLHALTLPQSPEQLLQWKRESLATLLAIGLDPERCTVFEQSRVPTHVELMWLLSCGASMGMLNRMTQWKVCFCMGYRVGVGGC